MDTLFMKRHYLSALTFSAVAALLPATGSSKAPEGLIIEGKVRSTLVNKDPDMKESVDGARQNIKDEKKYSDKDREYRNGVLTKYAAHYMDGKPIETTFTAFLSKDKAEFFIVEPMLEFLPVQYYAMFADGAMDTTAINDFEDDEYEYDLHRSDADHISSMPTLFELLRAKPAEKTFKKTVKTNKDGKTVETYDRQDKILAFPGKSVQYTYVGKNKFPAALTYVHQTGEFAMKEEFSFEKSATNPLETTGTFQVKQYGPGNIHDETLKITIDSVTTGSAVSNSDYTRYMTILKGATIHDTRLSKPVTEEQADEGMDNTVMVSYPYELPPSKAKLKQLLDKEQKENK